MKTVLDFDLRRLRVDTLNWPQPRMANFLGCGQSAVSRMESTGKVGVAYLKLLATLTPPFIITRTRDGNVIAFDPETGLSAFGPSEAEAAAELRRLLTERAARITELNELLGQTAVA